MMKSYEEVPNTIEGLRFYIDRGEKNIKDFKQRTKRLEELLGIAKERLRNMENAPKKEVMDEII